MTSDLWLCSAGVVGWRWQWLGFDDPEGFFQPERFRDSVIPNRAVSHLPTQPPRKILSARPEVRPVHKEKMILKLLF